MSVTATTTAASAALPILNLHPHGRKKGVHADSDGQSSAASTAAPSTTQGLFGRLLESLEQVIGVNTTAAASGAAASGAPAAGAGAAQAGKVTAASNAAIANGAAAARVDLKA